MATKRSIDMILNDPLIQKTKEVYQKAWDEFLAFVREKQKPEENDYLQYFDHLHMSAE